MSLCQYGHKIDRNYLETHDTMFYCRICGKSLVVTEAEINARLNGEDYGESEQGVRLSPRNPSGGQGAAARIECEETTIIWGLVGVS